MLGTVYEVEAAFTDVIDTAAAWMHEHASKVSPTLGLK